MGSRQPKPLSIGQNYQLAEDTALSRYLAFEHGLKFLMEDDFQNIWYNNGQETGMLVPEKVLNPFTKNSSSAVSMAGLMKGFHLYMP